MTHPTSQVLSPGQDERLRFEVRQRLPSLHQLQPDLRLRVAHLLSGARPLQHNAFVETLEVNLTILILFVVSVVAKTSRTAKNRQDGQTHKTDSKKSRERWRVKQEKNKEKSTSTNKKPPRTAKQPETRGMIAVAMNNPDTDTKNSGQRTKYDGARSSTSGGRWEA